MKRPAFFLFACVAVAAGCGATAPAAPPVTVASVPAPVAPPLPDLVFRAGEPPWRALGISTVFTSLASTAASLDALSRKLALPTPLGHTLVDALTSGRPGPGGVIVSRAMLDRVDPARPVVFVTLAPGIGISAGSCLGVTFRDAAGARRTLDELGVETARVGGESTRRLPSGSRVYAGVHGRTLLFSSDARFVSVAGPLVEALQTREDRGGRHVATVTVYPQALPVGAAVLGSGFEKVVTTALRTARAKNEPRTANGAASPLEVTEGLIAVAGRFARLAGGVLADTREARLELDLDEHVGFALRFVVEPVVDSALARALMPPTPARVDPRLRDGSSDMLFAWGTQPGRQTWIFDAFEASGPVGKVFVADMKAWWRLFTGPGTCRGNASLVSTTSVCAEPFARGVKLADVFRRYAALDKDAIAWLRELGVKGVSPPQLHVTRDALEIAQNLDVAGEPPAARARRHELLGGPIHHSVFVAHVADGLSAWAPDRAAAVAALAARVAPPTPALSAIVARGEGADVVGSFDLASLFRNAFQMSADPRLERVVVMLKGVKGLVDLHAPLGFTMRTGPSAAYELQLPVETLNDVAGVVRPYMGVMGAPPRR